MSVLPVLMPKLGAYTEDVLLSAWLVGEGEEVDAGRAIFELETEKTTAEVESEGAGFVHRLVRVGQTVPIGETVALVAQTQEEYEALLREGTERPVSPRARALLKELAISDQEAAGIVGTGPGGRVLDRDVAAWAQARGAKDEQAEAPALTVGATIPLRGRRGVIAARMTESLRTAAQLTSVLELDVKPLVELRARLNGTGATPRIGITAIVVKLTAAALVAHPRLNARVTEREIELLEEINIAVGIDTEDGIVAPVVPGADRLSIEEINARIADLAARARERRLTPVELEGGTFTVSNGGIHPVDITTAILNPPQCGILWIGRIRDRPVVVDGTVAVRPTMQACLTFDHRAVDGAPAAAFLATLASHVARLPELP